MLENSENNSRVASELPLPVVANRYHQKSLSIIPTTVAPPTDTTVLLKRMIFRDGRGVDGYTIRCVFGTHIIGRWRHWVSLTGRSSARPGEGQVREDGVSRTPKLVIVALLLPYIKHTSSTPPNAPPPSDTHTHFCFVRPACKRDARRNALKWWSRGRKARPEPGMLRCIRTARRHRGEFARHVM